MIDPAWRGALQHVLVSIPRSYPSLVCLINSTLGLQIYWHSVCPFFLKMYQIVDLAATKVFILLVGFVLGFQLNVSLAVAACRISS